jgi:hypothetical protein
MEKVTVGQRVTIECQGMTVTGTVITADHEVRYKDGKSEVIGYLLEVRTDAGRMHYWKSLLDGGSITIHPEASLQVIEVRIRYWFDGSTPWEALKCKEYRCHTAEQANTFCQVLLDSDEDITQIRWNRKGSKQGHYLESKKVGQ